MDEFGKMNKLILQTVSVCGVLFSAEAHEALVVYPCLKGLKRCHEDIDAEVKFVPIEEKRVRDVALYDNALTVANVADIAHEANSATPAQPHRLHYPNIFLVRHFCKAEKA